MVRLSRLLPTCRIWKMRDLIATLCWLLAAPQPLDDRILEELSNITDVEKVQLLPWKGEPA